MNFPPVTCRRPQAPYDNTVPERGAAAVYSRRGALGQGVRAPRASNGCPKKLELRLHPAGAAARLVLARRADGGGDERANPWLLSRGSRERPRRVHGLRAHG